MSETKDRAKGFILVGVDTEGIKAAFYKLSADKQNEVLKKALRMTAKQARLRLDEQAKAAYTVKDAGFKKAMRVSAGARAAKIRAEGEPLPLKSFKVRRGKIVRAQVLKHGHMKELVLSRGNIKAFINNIADKKQKRKKATKKGAKGSQVRHLAVAQREGSGRLHIHEKFSNSIPIMLGSERHVYGVVEPEIGESLQKYMASFIEQALGG